MTYTYTEEAADEILFLDLLGDRAPAADGGCAIGLYTRWVRQ